MFVIFSIFWLLYQYVCYSKDLGILGDECIEINKNFLIHGLSKTSSMEILQALVSLALALAFTIDLIPMKKV